MSGQQLSELVVTTQCADTKLTCHRSSRLGYTPGLLTMLSVVESLGRLAPKKARARRGTADRSVERISHDLREVLSHDLPPWCKKDV